MNPDAETIDMLADELYEWLETAEVADILNYVERLPEERLAVYEELRGGLLFRARYVRRQVVKRHFEGALTQMLIEPDITEFIGACSKYDATSVIANYAKTYPTLATIKVIDSPQVEAAQFYRLWQNVLIFRVARSFTALVQILRQLLRLNWTDVQFAAAQEQATAFFNTVNTKSTVENFIPTELDSKTVAGLQAFLASMTFIPLPEQQDLLKPENRQSLIVLLQKLMLVIDTVVPALQSGVLNTDADRLRALLLDDIADREEIDLAVADKMSREPEEADPYLENLSDYFLNLFKEQYLVAGLVPGELLKAYAPLPAPAKESFKTLLREFIVGTEVIKLWLDDVDPETVMTCIEQAGSNVAVEGVVQNLAQFLRDDNEQIGLEILKAIDRVYYP